MNTDMISLLKLHEFFRDASDEALQDVAAVARVIQYATGHIVHEADALLATVGFVLRGRLKAVRVDARVIAATNADLRAEVAAGRFARLGVDAHHHISSAARSEPAQRHVSDVHLVLAED